MLFYILMFIAIVAIPLGAAATWWIDSKDPKSMPGEAIAAGVFMGLIVTLVSGGVIFAVWTEHASDISKVVAQEHRIEVQQERIESLTQRLDGFDYPAKSNISLDADTPWASIVESLTDAENELAKAKDERAVAIRSIEARKRGPMSGVVSFVGDYER